MKTGTAKTALIIALLLLIRMVVPAADNTIKESAKAEDRMREEKKRDEREAKDQSIKVRVARFDSVYRPPRTDDIDVIQAHEPLSKAYKCVALLTFDCAEKEETQAVAGFIAKAKDLGADGVLIIALEPPSVQHSGKSTPDERRVFRANAIIYQSKQ